AQPCSEHSAGHHRREDQQMIAKAILIAGLLLCVWYAIAQRRKSRWVSAVILGVSLVGVYFVMFPDTTNSIAALVGIGRGADLLFYCWLVISLIVSVNLQFRILDLQGMITELTRELALQSAQDGATEKLSARDRPSR